MALTIKGTGIVTTNDFKSVTWTGKTKNGKITGIPKTLILTISKWGKVS